MYKKFLSYKIFAFLAFALLTYYFTVPAVYFHNIQDEIKSMQKLSLIPEFPEATYKVWNFYSQDRYSNLSVSKDQANDLRKRIENYHEIGAISVPVWRFSLFAPNYPIEAFPQGLPVFIHMDGLSGEVHEMDTINHYIGMKPMDEGAKFERSLVPYLLVGMSAFMFLFLMHEKKILDWVMVAPIVTPFAFLIIYVYWLYLFGHDLVDGAITIKPFMPVVIGEGRVAQFTTVSYPENGFWLLLIISALSALALFFKQKTFGKYRIKFGWVATLVSSLFFGYLFYFLLHSDINGLSIKKEMEAITIEKQAEVKEEKKEEDKSVSEVKKLERNIPTSALVKVSTIYKTRCSSCHGAQGEGSVGPSVKNLERDVYFKGLEDELHIEIVESLTKDELEALYEESKSF